MTCNGAVDAAHVLSHEETMADAMDAYEHCNDRDAGWIKAELVPVG